MKRLVITEQEKNRILGMHKGAILSEQSPETNTDVVRPESNTSKTDFTKFTIEGKPLEGLPVGEGQPYYTVRMFSDISKGAQGGSDKRVGRWMVDTKTFQPNELGKQMGFTEMKEKLPENCYTSMG